MAAKFPRVCVVHNGKGGVFKTTVVANCAAILAAANYNVLVIDMDPQGNVGEDLGYTDDPRADGGAGLAAALTNQTVLQPSFQARERLWVVPGGSVLARLTLPAEVDAFDMLIACLAPIAADYDMIFIDTPPGEGALVDAALGVARYLLVPTNPDRASIKGLSQVADSMQAAWQHNADLELMGAILVGLGPRDSRIRAVALEQLDATLGDPSLRMQSSIRVARKPAVLAREKGQVFHELASTLTKPFWKYLREGNRIPDTAASAPGVAQDFYHLTDEIIHRIMSAESTDADDSTEGTTSS